MALAFPVHRPTPVLPATQPVVIAHRGASGHRPEHTLAAYELAYRLGADSVELDLLATRDGVLVCRHDLELSRTTDVAQRPEFAHLRRTIAVGRTRVTGWFVHDFTLAELQELRTRERWPRKRHASAAFDGRFPIPTLDDVLALNAAESARAGRPLGVHAELKAVTHLGRHGLDVPDLIAGHPAASRADVTWFGFESDALRRLRVAGPVLRLYDERPTGLQLARATDYASGVAVRRKAVFPRRDDGRIGPQTALVEKAHRRGLSVLVWTHRAENQHLPVDFRVGGTGHGHGDASGEAALLFGAGIDGLITDHPETAVAARASLPMRLHG